MDVEYRFLNRPDDVQEGGWVTARKTGGAAFTARVFFNYLMTEHSPIRRLMLAWRVRNMERRASSHFARHVHSPCYVGGSRPDWFPKGVGDTNDHLQDSNCQALIDMMRKRLCFRPWNRTREVAVQLKRSLMAADVSRIGPQGDAPPAFYRQLGRVLVPNCVYRCGCPEKFAKQGCGHWDDFIQKAIARGACLREDFMDLQRRYDLYNDIFFGPEREEGRQDAN